MHVPLEVQIFTIFLCKGMLVAKMKFLILLLVTLAVIRGCKSHTVYISTEGKDHEHCGSKINKCKSISFPALTFTNLPANEKLEIIIDGGIKEQWIYEVNQTIKLPLRNVTIKKNPSSIFNPLIINPNIGTIKNKSKPYHAFESYDNVNITIESIDFRDLLILHHSNNQKSNLSTSCRIVLENSKAVIRNDSYINEDGFVTVSFSNSSSCSLELRGSKFTSENSMMTIYATMNGSTEVKLSVISSNFTGTGICLKSQNSTFPGTISSLIIDNTVFKKCTESPLNVAGILQKLVVTNSILVDNKSLKPSSNLLSVNVGEKVMQNNYGVRKIEFSNVTFANNVFNAIIVISQVSLFTLENITIDSNSFHTMIRIYSSSNINVVNFSVLNNTVVSDGLYIERCNAVILNKLLWKGNVCNSTMMQLFKIRTLSNLTDLRLEDNLIFFKRAIYFKQASVSITKVRTFRNSAKHTLLAFYTPGLTNMVANFDNVYGENEGCKHYVRSVYVSFMKVTNFRLVNVKSKNTAFYHWAYRWSKSSGRYDNMTFENVTGKLIFLRVNNAFFSNIEVHRSQLHTILETWGVKNVTVVNVTASEITAKENIFDIKHKSEADYRNLYFVNNTILEDMIISVNGINQILQNVTIINNTILDNVFQGYQTELSLRDMTIYNNNYTTGISMMNSVINIDRLSMYQNVAKKELFFADTFILYKKNPDPEKLCLRFFQKSLMTISNTVINSTVSSPYATQFSSIAFVMDVPSVVSNNFTINLDGYQRTALELYVSKRAAGRFHPDFLIHCPKGYAPNFTNDTMKSMAFKYEVDCTPCNRNTYSPERGRIHIKGISRKKLPFSVTKNYEVIDRIQIDHNKTITPECIFCPIGGDCNQGKAKTTGNSYGYVTPKGTSKFLHCPTNYCCSNRTSCTDLQICAPNREGMLCGNCKDGYQERFFHASCMENKQCTDVIVFWIVFFVIVLLIFLFVFLFDIVFDISASNDNVFTMGRTKGVPLNIIESNRTVKDLQSMYETVNFEHINQDNSSNDKKPTADMKMNDDADSESESNQVRIGSNAIKIETASRDDIKVSKEENIDSSRFYTAATIFNIFVSYYQLRSLILLEGINQNRFSKFFSNLFNGGTNFEYDAYACPYLNLSAVDKSFIKMVLPLFIMLAILCVFVLSPIGTFMERFVSLRSKRASGSLITEKFSSRAYMEVCYSKILLFNYKNIAYFCFVALHCVSINNEASMLYINGNVKCYKSWQYVVVIFLALWVTPFPFTVEVANNLYRSHKITYHQYMSCLTFPLLTVWYYCKYKHCKRSKTAPYKSDQLEFVNRIFTEPYRVIVGTDGYPCWELWRLLQRLLFVVICIFVINPLYKVTVMFPCIVLFTVIYIKVKPYKERYWILHWLEILSLLNCFTAIGYSFFHAFERVYVVSDGKDMENFLKAFSFVELVLSPIVVSLFFLIYSIFYNGYQVLKKTIDNKINLYNE